MSIEIIQEMKPITVLAIFFLIYVASAARPFQVGGRGALSPAEPKHIRGKVGAALKKPQSCATFTLLKILSGPKQVVAGMEYDLEVALDVQRVGQTDCPVIVTGKGVYHLVIWSHLPQLPLFTPRQLTFLPCRSTLRNALPAE